jgi:uncharacterized RDD family membrane protein YckC
MIGTLRKTLERDVTGGDPLARVLITPEGVPLRFRLASGGQRLAGFMIDVMLVIGALIALNVLAHWAQLFTGDEPWLQSVLMIASFLLFNFYFAFSELTWQGKTLGKRLLGTRVIAHPPGPLSAVSVFTRNLTRNVEVWIPLQSIAQSAFTVGDGPQWASFGSLLWLLVLMLFPLFNSERARIGDLVAGTMVVQAPSAKLLDDLAAAEPRGLFAGRSFTFTRPQLGHYGIHELQVLEHVLRSPRTFDGEVKRRVVERISAKIGYATRVEPGDFDAFLTSFYGAQRTYLEQQLLLGKRRAHKGV